MYKTDLDERLPLGKICRQRPRHDVRRTHLQLPPLDRLVGLSRDDVPTRDEAKRRRLKTVMQEQELMCGAAQVVESGRRLALKLSHRCRHSRASRPPTASSRPLDTTTVGVPTLGRSSPAKCEACAIFCADAPGPRRGRRSISTGPKSPVQDIAYDAAYQTGFSIWTGSMRHHYRGRVKGGAMSGTVNLDGREARWHATRAGDTK